MKTILAIYSVVVTLMLGFCLYSQQEFDWRPGEFRGRIIRFHEDSIEGMRSCCLSRWNDNGHYQAVIHIEFWTDEQCREWVHDAYGYDELLAKIGLDK